MALEKRQALTRGGDHIDVIDGREKNEAYVQLNVLIPAAIRAIKDDAKQYSGTMPAKYQQFLQNKNNHHAKQAWNELINRVEIETKIKAKSFITALADYEIRDTAEFSAWKAAVHHDRAIATYSTLYQTTLKNDLINLTKNRRGKGYIEIGNYDDFLDLTKGIKNLFDHSAIMPWKVRRKGEIIVFTPEDMRALEPNQLDYLALMAQTAKRGFYCSNKVVARAMNCAESTISRIKDRINRALLKRYKEEVEIGNLWSDIFAEARMPRFNPRDIEDGFGWHIEKPSLSRGADEDESLRVPKYDRETIQRMGLDPKDFW